MANVTVRKSDRLGNQQPSRLGKRGGRFND
nr:MAG TPA: hypothetical protein [Caudoviricetes sp.]